MPIARAAILALWLACAPAWAGSILDEGDQGRSGQVAQTLRDLLGSLAAGGALVVQGTPLLAPEIVARFYRARDFAPLWHREGNAPGPRVGDLLQALQDARLHGLDPQTYHARLLADLETQPEAAADLELLATDAFITQALHRAHGRLRPETVDPEWHLFVTEADPEQLLRQIADGVPVRIVLDGLWPEAPGYWRLVQEKHRLQESKDAAPPRIPPGPLLRRGKQDPRIAALRARLGLPPAAGDLFDAEIETAVREFQQSQGLGIDGIVGPNTLELLNISNAGRIARIDVNLERWRWLMRTLPATRVQVNVADYALQVFDAGQEALRMNVIVGTPFRRTPVFTAPMRYLVFNPDWQVPRKIAVEDKLPLLQKDAGALAALGYEARLANSPAPLQPVDAFDWSTVTPRTFRYLLRQRPGPGNALGQVKFILPNPYSVYLHDTPTRQLFARTGRAFSSGCIRLEHAMVLADWVLRDQPQWTRGRIDAVLALGETMEVSLKQPLPVLVLYFTAVAGESGTVYYRPDLYGRDAAVAAALGLD